ncbi:MAG: tripartite tricarboxylate transporter permease [Synergistales bacterium]|nr:tripartite tricarboxylate transporter permease [Synergistales bacterium]
MGEIFTNLALGFTVVLDPLNFALLLVGSVLGTVFGMLPGIGPATGIALLLPLTFAMKPETALIMMCAIYYGAMYGGSRGSILLNVPGDGAAVAATFDGYPMAQNGRAEAALAISAIASFIGGLIATVIFVFLALPVARFALRFGPPEYFMLMIFALSATASLTQKSLLKGFFALVMGLMVTTVGMDLMAGVRRFTFGVQELQSGIDFIVVIVGVYGIGEVFTNYEKIAAKAAKPVQEKFGKIWITMEEWKQSIGPILRQTPVGFFVGVLPGSGGTIGSMMGYNNEKQISKHPEKFGTGTIEGLAAPEAANNAASVGALIPMMTLGVPGSGTTAVMLGALLILGLDPGPMLFEHHPHVAWGIIASMFMGNIACAVINIPLAGLLVRVLSVKPKYLYPLIVGLAFVGVYTINYSVVDFFLLLVFGVVGYLMKKLKIPIAPFILAVVVGGGMEQSFRQALMVSQGDMTIFFRSTICNVLFGLSVLSVSWPFISEWRKKRKARQAGGTSGR